MKCECKECVLCKDKYRSDICFSSIDNEDQYFDVLCEKCHEADEKDFCSLFK